MKTWSDLLPGDLFFEGTLVVLVLSKPKVFYDYHELIAEFDVMHFLSSTPYRDSTTPRLGKFRRVGDEYVQSRLIRNV